MFEAGRHRARLVERALFCRSLGLHRSVESRRASSSASQAPNRIHEILQFAARHSTHRPGSISLAPGPLLMGCQVGLEPVAFTVATHGRWGRSTPMSESPHVELLREALNARRALSDEEIMHSPYWEFAQDLIGIAGEFFGMTSDHDVLGVVRNFIEWGLGGSSRVTSAGGSAARDEVLVARVPGSTKFQIVDGHHRVAVAIIRGDTTIRVSRTWLSTGVPEGAE